MQKKTGVNLQDAFLNIIKNNNIPVSIYLVGGQNLKGIITGYDSYVIILDSGGKSNMIYKHAISTITPSTYVTLKRDENNGDAKKQVEQ